MISLKWRISQFSVFSFHGSASFLYQRGVGCRGTGVSDAVSKPSGARSSEKTAPSDLETTRAMIMMLTYLGSGICFPPVMLTIGWAITASRIELQNRKIFHCTKLYNAWGKLFFKHNLKIQTDKIFLGGGDFQMESGLLMRTYSLQSFGGVGVQISM